MTSSRRSFLRTSLQAGLVLGTVGLGSVGRAIEPFQRGGKARLQLSLAAYSFRDYFKDVNGKGKKKQPATGKSIDLFDFIDFCAEHGCAGAELTSYYFPQDATEEYFIRIRRHAFLRGVAISGTSVGNTFALPVGEQLTGQINLVKKWVDNAALLGTSHVRVFAGDAKKAPVAEMQKNCIAALEECCEYAGQKGVFIGLENHGGIVAEPDGLLTIVKAVKNPWLGVNLDTGNFRTADPYTDFARCAPYAVNVQVKVKVHPNGKENTTEADLPRFIQILRDANYQGWVALEHEDAKKDPWEDVPVILKQLKSLLSV